MNTWQLARQIKYLIRSRSWPESSPEKVFGDVIVSAALDEDTFGLLTFPYVIINPQDGDADTENAEWTRQVFSVVLGTRVEGGQFGEEALLGGVRSNGVAGSGGRGLLELEEELLAAISMLTGADGVNATSSYRTGAAAGIVQGIGYVAQRAYRIECMASRARYYHPPQNLRKSGGNIVWTLPPDRFDRYKIILRKAAGATPPSGPTDGDDVPLGSDLATSVANSDTTTAFAIFCEYDESQDPGETLVGAPSGQERYSDASSSIPGTTLVVA